MSCKLVEWLQNVIQYKIFGKAILLNAAVFRTYKCKMRRPLLKHLYLLVCFLLAVGVKTIVSLDRSGNNHEKDAHLNQDTRTSFDQTCLKFVMNQCIAEAMCSDTLKRLSHFHESKDLKTFCTLNSFGFHALFQNVLMVHVFIIIIGSFWHLTSPTSTILEWLMPMKCQITKQPTTVLEKEMQWHSPTQPTSHQHIYQVWSHQSVQTVTSHNLLLLW